MQSSNGKGSSFVRPKVQFGSQDGANQMSQSCGAQKLIRNTDIAIFCDWLIELCHHVTLLDNHQALKGKKQKKQHKQGKSYGHVTTTKGDGQF